MADLWFFLLESPFLFYLFYFVNVFAIKENLCSLKGVFEQLTASGQICQKYIHLIFLKKKKN